MPEQGTSSHLRTVPLKKKATRLIIVSGTPLGIFDLRVEVTFGSRNVESSPQHLLPPEATLLQRPILAVPGATGNPVGSPFTQSVDRLGA